MIIGGAAAAVVSFGEILFSAELTKTAGNGGWIIAYPVIALIANACECITGIFGVRVKNDHSVPIRTFLMGLITIVLNIAVILIAMVPLHTPVFWVTWLISLFVPVLFTVCALFGTKMKK